MQESSQFVEGYLLEKWVACSRENTAIEFKVNGKIIAHNQ